MVQKYRVIKFLRYFSIFWGAGKISIIIPIIGVDASSLLILNGP